MAEVKDKVVTVESLNALHDYDESTFLKISGALGTLGITATAAEINKLDGVTATTAELNYVDGVTSNIQTQLNGKQGTITGGASTIAGSNLTASRALVSNASGKVAVSAVTSTELGYLDGVTSAIQTQLDNRHIIGNNLTIDKTSSPNITFNLSGEEATKIYKNASSTADYGTMISDYNSAGERDALTIRRSSPTLEGKLTFKIQNEDGGDDIHYIYGTHTPNLMYSNENGNCVIGWDNYNGGSGDTNIYGENVHIYALNADGTTPAGAVFVGRNENNHTLINNAAHLDTSKVSDTYIYGRAVHIDTNDTNFIVDGIQLAKVSETTCTLASGWAQYTDGGNVYANRYGKVVTVTGSLKNTTALTSSGTKVKMFTVPSGYRPARSVNFVCHGAGVMTWLLTIGVDGVAYISRHGASAYSNVAANEGYFVFTATYVANN